MYKNISRFIYRIRNELSTYFIHSYVPSSLHLADCSSPPEIVLPSAPLFSCPSASLRSATGSPLEVSTEVQSSTLQPRSLGVALPFGDRKLEEATTASGKEVDWTSSGGAPCNGNDEHTLNSSSSGDHELTSTFIGDDINVTLNSYLFSNKSFHLTAAIVYANGLPHIGHAYEAVSCDVIARFYRLFGRDVLFSVGTDEHGQKVMATAMKDGKSPIEICDYYSSYLKNKYKELLISNSIFLRTTDKRHYKIATAIWNKILSNGDIYLGEYNGWYSIREERFIPNTEALITDYKDPCTGKPYDNMTEPSYFFTMEKYRSKLIQHINNNPYFIRPDRTRNEVLSRLQNPLEDLSISRTSFKWGIPVPNDNQHVMYVWMDALTNYITGSILYHQHKQNIKNTTTIPFCTNSNPLEVQSNSSPLAVEASSNYLSLKSNATPGDRGEGGESKCWTSSGIPGSDLRELEGEVNREAVCKTTSDGLASGVEDGDVFMFDDFDKIMNGVRWPPDIQVMGKDISWFHCVILPCILMSLGLELPKTLYSHGFIKSSTGMKMSKSFGNVISIDYLLDNYGVEAFRYFVMRSNSFGSDINFDLINLVDLFNSELADNIGNLIHRLTNLTSKYCNGVVPIMENVRVKTPIDTVGILNTIIKSMELYDIQMAIITCINGFKECNLYLTKCAPWFCNDEKIRNCYIRVLLEAVYFLSHFLIPIIPNTSIKIFNKFNTKPKDHILQLSTNYNNLIDGTKIDIGDILFNKLTHDNN